MSVSFSPPKTSWGVAAPPGIRCCLVLFPKHAPFAIGYTFEDRPHDYLPDVVGTLTNGEMFSFAV